MTPIFQKEKYIYKLKIKMGKIYIKMIVMIVPRSWDHGEF